MQVSDNGSQALAGLTALTSLSLCGCDLVSDDGLRALAELTALTRLEHSRKLSLEEFQQAHCTLL